MPTFDVDVLVQSPLTMRVEAETPGAASMLALDGKGENVSGVDYTYGEVVEVREVVADAV